MNDILKGFLICIIFFGVYSFGHWRGHSAAMSKKGLFPRLFGQSEEPKGWFPQPERQPEREFKDAPDSSKGPIRRFLGIADVDGRVAEMHRLHTEYSHIERGVDANLCEQAEKHSEDQSIIGLGYYNLTQKLRRFGTEEVDQTVVFGRYRFDVHNEGPTVIATECAPIFAGMLKQDDSRDRMMNEKYTRVGYGWHRKGNRIFWTIIFAGPDETATAMEIPNAPIEDAPDAEQ